MTTNQIIKAMERLDSKIERTTAEVEESILVHEIAVNIAFLAIVGGILGYFYFAV